MKDSYRLLYGRFAGGFFPKQKLVNETFQNMWFVPKRDKEADKLLTRVMNVTDVVAACRETGYDWFEQLLENVSN